MDETLPWGVRDPRRVPELAASVSTRPETRIPHVPSGPNPVRIQSTRDSVQKQVPAATEWLSHPQQTHRHFLHKCPLPTRWAGPPVLKASSKSLCLLIDEFNPFAFI